MPRRRWRTRARREHLTADIRHYLETGSYGRTVGASAEDRHQFSFAAFQLAGHVIRGDYDELRELWSEYGDDVLAGWIAEAPGTRPFGWWICGATEPRRCLTGAAHLHPGAGELWRRDFGMPWLQQLGHCSATFESQAAYLDRVGRLGADERLALDADAFAPEIVRVDADTLEEIVARRAGREKGTT